MYWLGNKDAYAVSSSLPYDEYDCLAVWDTTSQTNWAMVGKNNGVMTGMMVNQTVGWISADQYPAGYSNVTQDFLAWFAFGFFYGLIQICAVSLLVIGALLRSPIIFHMANFCRGLNCCGLLCLVITGQVFYFRLQGQICTGIAEYPTTAPLANVQVPFASYPGALISSGKFIMIYCIIVECCLCLFCCCAVGCMAYFTQKKIKASRDYN